MDRDDRDIFISYVEEDGAVARALATDLRALGQSTWTYQEDGVPGISYLTQVHRAIVGCRAFVLLASENSVNAHQVIREVEQAHELEKIIVPVRVGLTHQQFIAANPILRMASGTAVTLDAEEANLSGTARRISDTLRLAAPRGADAELRRPRLPEQPTSRARIPRGATRASSEGRPGSAGVLSDISSFRPRSAMSGWMWLSVWFAIVANLYSAGLGVFIAAAVLHDERNRRLVTVIAFLAAIVAVACGVLLARFFIKIRRSSHAMNTQLISAKRYLVCHALSLVILGVFLNLALESRTTVIFFLFTATTLALVWNALEVLQRAADDASG
jgi:TIR domain